MSRDKKQSPPPVPEPLAEPIVDAHTHLDACGAVSAQDVRAIMDRAERAGVARAVTVADDMESVRWVPSAAEADQRVFAAIALHPTRAGALNAEARVELERIAAHPRVVAVGETGLDYYWPSVQGLDHDVADAATQREAFRWHIDLAKRIGKPLMIHDREAHEDILRVLEEEGAPETVIFHCFSGDTDMARRAIEAGYLLSFAGTVTFKNAAELRAAASMVPEGQLLVETDAPFLTPHPHRGKPNEPYCAAYTLRGLAEVRHAEEAELAATVRVNAERAFALPHTPSVGVEG